MEWLYPLIYLTAFIGHCFIAVAVCNRIDGLQVSLRTLRLVGASHMAAMAGFPALLLFMHRHGYEPLITGLPQIWSIDSVAWTAYLVTCVATTLAASSVVVLRALQRPPVIKLSNHSKMIDIATLLGRCPIGKGRRQWVARLPGNEQFALHISEKTYRHPRLPQDFDGLSIAHLSDVHFTGTVDRAYFEQVARSCMQLAPDMIVFTGDLLDSAALVDWLPATLGRLSAPLGCYFVLGNHDWYCGAEAPRRRLIELGWHDVSSRFLLCNSDRQPLLVAGTERPWMGEHPDLASAPTDAFRILLSHTPDHIEWARRQDFDVMLAGHNHGGQIRFPVIGPIYSPSTYGCRFAAGDFYKPPTLLHVSRGISGRTPYRWRCPPELTAVVLRSAGTDAAPVGSTNPARSFVADEVQPVTMSQPRDRELVAR